MTFDEWWSTLTPAEHKLIGRTNAKYVWLCATEIEREACALIADKAEPYQSADLIRARGRHD